MTGFRIAPQLGVIKKRLGTLAKNTRADNFKPDLSRFVQASLKDALAATPVRSEQLITRNQIQQYQNRINYIPSVHTLENPTLIHNEQGQDWVYVDGKWYNTEWRLPDSVFAAYSMLEQERQRRMQMAQQSFVDARKQSRFLYQRTWWQIAQSLGLALSVSAAIIGSHSRRKPQKEPNKAYGQWRGGMKVLSVAIYNTFLDEKTKYWKGNGKQILAQAQAKNRPRFLKECNDKVKREISAARRTS